MRYPGIGKKTAERYAFHTLHRFENADIADFIDSLHRVKDEIKPCERCGHLTDDALCTICKDERRDYTKLLVVETSRDVIVIERSRSYEGLYHVLDGVIAPSEGVGPEDIRIKPLLERLRNSNIKEVILALNLSDEGETTAMYINRLLEKTDLLCTRIAYGLPAGGNIGYADVVTLHKALEGRKKY